MRIVYLSHSYVPSRRADSIQVMKMCSAWAELGHDVTLVSKHCPPRQEPHVTDDHSFYGVPSLFEITKLPRPVWRGGGWLFSRAVARLIDRESPSVDLFFCRDIDSAEKVATRNLPFAFEAHVPPQSARIHRKYRRTLNAESCSGLVVISRALASHFERSGLLPDKLPLIVAPDAADDPVDEATGSGPVESNSGTHVGYVGQLYSGKGFDQVVALASSLPSLTFHVVGGEDTRLDELRRQAQPPNLILHGFVPPHDLERHYATFDMVLMPYSSRVLGASGRTDLVNWMSPMKMFEYMAAGLPIIASDLPVLREVLRDGDNALLAPADDLGAWSAAILRLQGDSSLRQQLGGAAQEDLRQHYTWSARARRVLEELAV